MKKRVFIFGNKGNMGQRYAAIIKALDHTPVGIDIDSAVSLKAIEALGRTGDIDAFIIATPTATHLDICRHLVGCGKPVLCEKPLVKSSGIADLEMFLMVAEASGMQLSMVSQYDYLLQMHDACNYPILNKYKDKTRYNYFKTGNDGIAWDCINIIYHANGPVELRNDSPIWRCTINGKVLDSSDIDLSYVRMIADWLEKPYEPQYGRILKAHQKVMDYLSCTI